MFLKNAQSDTDTQQQADRHRNLETVLTQWADFVKSIREDFGLLQELQKGLYLKIVYSNDIFVAKLYLKGCRFQQKLNSQLNVVIAREKIFYYTV